MSSDDQHPDEPSIPVLEEVIVPGNPEAAEAVESNAKLRAALSTLDNIDADVLGPLLKQIASEIQEDFKHEILDEIIPAISAAVHEQVSSNEVAIQQKMVFLLQERLPEMILALNGDKKS